MPMQLTGLCAGQIFGIDHILLVQRRDAADFIFQLQKQREYFLTVNGCSFHNRSIGIIDLRQECDVSGKQFSHLFRAFAFGRQGNIMQFGLPLAIDSLDLPGENPRFDGLSEKGTQQAAVDLSQHFIDILADDDALVILPHDHIHRAPQFINLPQN
ncbi:hypothetical protein SDC9_163196 [bioreactor metagenome]|uniref:Uncharacterized protein n=1 Tax=bioreactor metagenome TaxID=1076179 RepID=A0A645FPH6_9ZZZZ